MKKKSLKDTLHEEILKEIITGEYSPNCVITELEVAKKYNVSRAPAREALLQFCNEGILKNIPRCGYLLPAITPKQIFDAYEMRIILELASLEKIIKTITSEQILELELNVQEAQQINSSDDAIELWEQNIKFHLLLCSFSDNILLYQALDKNLKLCYRSAPKYFQSVWIKRKVKNDNIHALIIQALKNGNMNRAKKLLKKDISEIHNAY